MPRSKFKKLSLQLHDLFLFFQGFLLQTQKGTLTRTKWIGNSNFLSYLASSGPEKATNCLVELEEWGSRVWHQKKKKNCVTLGKNLFLCLLLLKRLVFQYFKNEISLIKHHHTYVWRVKTNNSKTLMFSD